MALHSICRAFALHCGTSFGQRRMVEKNQPLVVAVCSLLFIIPFAVLNGPAASVETVLECVLNDYLTFIVLLFGLFCVAGNITLKVTLQDRRELMWHFWDLVLYLQV